MPMGSSGRGGLLKIEENFAKKSRNALINALHWAGGGDEGVGGVDLDDAGVPQFGGGFPLGRRAHSEKNWIKCRD